MADTEKRRAPRSRADRQRETRNALIMAALVAFTRDGYHGASLDGIASEAGFSKGAVYSNFDGKAELFLAVMDHNLGALRGDDWDPFSPPEPSNADTLDAISAGDDDAAEMLRGFGLATLEFFAIAARDDRLITELQARFEVLLDAYGRVATENRPDHEDLPVHDVARLLVGLDQGISVLMLGGVVAVDGDLLRTGLRRLLHPAEASSAAAGDHIPHPDVRRVRQLLQEPTD